MQEVLVNRLGGLSLPRKSVVRLTDRPGMTSVVYRGRKRKTQPTNQPTFPVYLQKALYGLGKQRVPTPLPPLLIRSPSAENTCTAQLLPCRSDNPLLCLYNMPKQIPDRMMRTCCMTEQMADGRKLKLYLNKNKLNNWDTLNNYADCFKKWNSLVLQCSKASKRCRIHCKPCRP